MSMIRIPNNIICNHILVAGILDWLRKDAGLKGKGIRITGEGEMPAKFKEVVVLKIFFLYFCYFRCFVRFGVLLCRHFVISPLCIHSI